MLWTALIVVFWGWMLGLGHADGDPCKCGNPLNNLDLDKIGCYPSIDGEEPTCYVNDAEKCSSVVGTREIKGGRYLPDWRLGWRTCKEEYKRDSALFEAAEKNDLAAIQALIEQGADINVRRGTIVVENGKQENHSPPTPTQIAIQHGSFEVIEFLVFSGGYPSPLFCKKEFKASDALCSLSTSEMCKDEDVKGTMTDFLDSIDKKNEIPDELCFPPIVETKRIKQGSPRECKRFPYFVSFRTPLTFSHFCGGVVVDEKYVLAAAHCVDPVTSSLGYNLPSLVIGQNVIELPGWAKRPEACHNFEMRRSVNITLHPKWTGKFASGYDFALVEMDRKVQSWRVKHPSLRKIGKNLGTNSVLSVIGLGRQGTKSAFASILQQINITQTDRGTCRLMHGQALGGNIVCAMGKEGAEFCKGDDGGPLFLDKGNHSLDELIGIVHKEHPFFPCGTPNLPGLYSLITPQIAKWMSEIINRG